MGIMPHTDVQRALDLALSLDIPFWPQLPNVSFYEDMYVQASEHLPGIRVDHQTQRVVFDTGAFREEVAAAYMERLEDPQTFILSPAYSAVYSRFLKLDLSGYAAIRGQLIGPVSFGFRVNDQELKPIIYNDEVRTILFDFLQRKVNAQYRQLKERNRNAFVWLDEPGLGWVFSGMTGYDEVKARADYDTFLSGVEGPRALHLCAAVNLPYLLSLGVDILSFDAYQIEVMPKGYAEAVGAFLKKGGILSWGIVPTDSEGQSREGPDALARRLSAYWGVVAAGSDVSVGQIARQALIAPARCMLKNVGRVGAAGERTADRLRPERGEGSGQGGAKSPVFPMSTEERLVETGFEYTRAVSRILRAKYV